MFNIILNSSDSIGIIGHQNPDIDCISSMLSIANIVNKHIKDYQLYLQKPLNAQLQSLNLDNLNFQHKLKQHDKFISVDCANYQRLTFHPNPDKIINIDHHASNTNYGDFNIVDKNSVSTTHLIFKLLESQHYPINKKLANLLLTGIYADTQSLQTTNVGSQVLKDCAKLTRLGANPINVAKKINSINTHNLKTLGKALLNTKIYKKYAVSRTTGNLNTDHLRISSKYISQVTNTKMSILITEDQNGENRTSLRSNTIAVNQIAQHFNGGGHKNASGFEYKRKH